MLRGCMGCGQTGSFSERFMPSHFSWQAQSMSLEVQLFAGSLSRMCVVFLCFASQITLDQLLYCVFRIAVALDILIYPYRAKHRMVRLKQHFFSPYPPYCLLHRTVGLDQYGQDGVECAKSCYVKGSGIEGFWRKRHLV